VVPLSVDTERFTAPDPAAVEELRARYGPPLLLFVGRLRYYKGLHFLLEALPQMRRDARLLLVGTGPEEERLRAQVQAAGLGQRVHFLGEVDDAQLPACYHAADAFVLPSHLRSEAFGIVQLEAQAAGLPIVCTELGTGTSHVTQHGITGLVVPPAEPAALARALDLLVANPALARCLGTAGRARVVREFSHERLFDRMTQVYTEVQHTRL
jgi:rhamnosyl/mannosyltransferase